MKRFALLSLLIVSLTLVPNQLSVAQGPMPATPQHKELEAELGVWDAEMKLWPTPESEPVVSKASETNTPLGSYWVVSKFEGDVMGMPFTGIGQYGYDPVAKKYIGTWVDSVSPYLSVLEGEKDAEGRLVMMAKGRDMETGKEQISKMISSYQDNDHRKFEAYGPVPGKEGEWWKMMEIDYTRRN